MRDRWGASQSPPEIAGLPRGGKQQLSGADSQQLHLEKID